MPTQNCHNLQGETSFDLPDSGAEVDILATGVSDNSYLEGMSVNGGSVLNLMVFNRSNTLGDVVTLKWYRRLTPDGEWSYFDTETVAINTRDSFRKTGISGFSNVRVTAQGAAVRAQNILASASITTL